MNIDGKILNKILANRGFPGGVVVGGLPADAGDVGLCPSLGVSHMSQSGWTRE